MYKNSSYFTSFPTLDWEDLLEKEMATHSSTLAWNIPWTEEPGRLQSAAAAAKSLQYVRFCVTP